MREVDQMEIWEVAAGMGLARPPEADPSTNGHGVGWQPPPRDLVAERMAYARGEGPKPEPDVPTSALLLPGSITN